MEERTDGRTDGRMDRWMDEWMDERFKIFVLHKGRTRKERLVTIQQMYEH